MTGEKRDRSKVLALFDVDGTLTEARKVRGRDRSDQRLVFLHSIEA